MPHHTRDIEKLNVNNTETAHRVISMPRDGSCMFHSIAYSLYNSINYEQASLIRAKIVEYVCENWDELNAWTVNRQGEPYDSLDIYREQMLKSNTYGSVCELRAAGCLYPIRIEVYRDGKLEGVFGDEDQQVKRFRFSGHYLRGHYDVCLLFDELFNKIESDEYTCEDEMDTEEDYYMEDNWYPKRNKGGRRQKEKLLTRKKQFK